MTYWSSLKRSSLNDVIVVAVSNLCPKRNCHCWVCQWYAVLELASAVVGAGGLAISIPID